MCMFYSSNLHNIKLIVLVNFVVTMISVAFTQIQSPSSRSSVSAWTKFSIICCLITFIYRCIWSMSMQQVEMQSLWQLWWGGSCPTHLRFSNWNVKAHVVSSCSPRSPEWTIASLMEKHFWEEEHLFVVKTAIQVTRAIDQTRNPAKLQITNFFIFFWPSNSGFLLTFCFERRSTGAESDSFPFKDLFI